MDRGSRDKTCKEDETLRVTWWGGEIGSAIIEACKKKGTGRGRNKKGRQCNWDNNVPFGELKRPLNAKKG